MEKNNTLILAILGILVAFVVGWNARGLSVSKISNDAVSPAVEQNFSQSNGAENLNRDVATPVLSEAQARGLLSCYLKGDEYSTCSISIETISERDWKVTAMFSGQHDDSSSDGRTIAYVTLTDEGVFNITRKEGSWKCSLGRGHQDYSTDKCI